MIEDGMGIHDHVTVEGRSNSGIPGLDSLLSGGYPKGSVILVSGTPGTGKTIVCFQFIHEGLSRGEHCLYISSDEPIEHLLHEAKKIGLDFYKAIETDHLKFMFLDLDSYNIHKQIEDEIAAGEYDRVVLDSLSPLSETPIWMVTNGNEIIPAPGSMTTTSYPIDSIQAMRSHVRRLMNILKTDACTTIVTSEVPEGSRNLSRDSISEFLVDGILLLDLDTTMDRRKITIRKMRGTKHTLKPQDMEITEGGAKIL